MKKILGFLLFGMMFILTACSQTKTAKELHKDGVDCFNNGNYVEAEKYLAQAVTANPDKAEYYIDYGMSLVKTQNYESALIQFDKAILDKDNKIVRENNKLALRGKGIAYFENALYEQGIAEFDKALEIAELDKLNLDILYYKGDAEDKAGLYEDAKETYERILKSDKSNVIVYSKLGQIYEALGKGEEALGHYDHAILMDKHNYDLYFGKYFLLLSLDKEEEAKAVLTDALVNTNAKTDEEKYQLARLHYYQADYETAEMELSSSVSNGFIEANYYLGELNFKLKNYKEAVQYYEAYLENEKSVKSAAVYNQLGTALIKTKNYKKALEYLEQGIALRDESKMYNLLFNEIIAYEYLVEFDTALQKSEDFLKLYPKDKKITREKKFILTRVEKKEKE